MKAIINITPDGIVETIKSDELPIDSLGSGTMCRASHVLPCHPVKRAAFLALRALFGERGRVASWCRTWQGPWQVRWAFAPSQVVFVHQSRRVCIAWEIDRLNERFEA